MSHPRDNKYLGECTLRIQTDGYVEASEWDWFRIMSTGQCVLLAVLFCNV